MPHQHNSLLGHSLIECQLFLTIDPMLSALCSPWASHLWGHRESLFPRGGADEISHIACDAVARKPLHVRRPGSRPPHSPQSSARSSTGVYVVLDTRGTLVASAVRSSLTSCHPRFAAICRSSSTKIPRRNCVLSSNATARVNASVASPLTRLVA